MECKRNKSVFFRLFQGYWCSQERSLYRKSQQLVDVFGGEPKNTGECVCNVIENLENLVEIFEEENISESLIIIGSTEQLWNESLEEN